MVSQLVASTWPDGGTRSGSSTSPSWPRQGAGIGTFLLKGLISESEVAEKPLSFHVERFNPALRLYERLGFERRPAKASTYFWSERPGPRNRSPKPTRAYVASFLLVCTLVYTRSVDAGDWFDWVESNEDHILTHGVEPGEVEEALLDPEGFGTDAYDVPREQREALVGATGEGRILFVVYTIRGEKVRPVTARDASDAQKRRYRRGRR
jgi:uncharacterized protein